MLVLALAGAAIALTPGCHSVFLRPGIVGETRLETASFQLRTDLSADARKVLVVAAEDMRKELEAVYPAPAEEKGEGRREIIAFAAPADFRRFLRSHLFSQERAIGFYCDLGGECALTWRDPPGPEDVRVLRHELVHQHLAVRLGGRIPAWLEEGLAERHALGPGGEAGGWPPRDDSGGVLGGDRGWAEYRARRFAADAIFAALAVHAGRRSWLDGADHGTRRVPPPTWAAGEGGYVLHLLFVRFLESIGEGGSRGALGACLARAAEGGDAELDLSRRYKSVAELEGAFHGYVLREGLDALLAEAQAGDEDAREAALRQITALGAAHAGTPAVANPAPAPFGARLALPAPAPRPTLSR